MGLGARGSLGIWFYNPRNPCLLYSLYFHFGNTQEHTFLHGIRLPPDPLSAALERASTAAPRAAFWPRLFLALAPALLAALRCLAPPLSPPAR
jgi:hypothetical protein